MDDAHEAATLRIEACQKRARVHLARLAIRLVEDCLLALSKRGGLTSIGESDRRVRDLCRLREVDKSRDGCRSKTG